MFRLDLTPVSFSALPRSHREQPFEILQVLFQINYLFTISFAIANGLNDNTVIKLSKIDHKCVI